MGYSTVRPIYTIHMQEACDRPTIRLCTRTTFTLTACQNRARDSSLSLNIFLVPAIEQDFFEIFEAVGSMMIFSGFVSCSDTILYNEIINCCIKRMLENV